MFGLVQQWIERTYAYQYDSICTIVYNSRSDYTTCYRMLRRKTRIKSPPRETPARPNSSPVRSKFRIRVFPLAKVQFLKQYIHCEFLMCTEIPKMAKAPMPKIGRCRYYTQQPSTNIDNLDFKIPCKLRVRCLLTSLWTIRTCQR